MDYTHLGKTGLRVSRICLGMMSYGSSEGRPWVLDEPDAEPIVRAAVEGGITFFDTADMYSLGASEEVSGRLLAKYLARDDAVVATKLLNPGGPGGTQRGLGRKPVLASIDASLRRLGMD